MDVLTNLYTSSGLAGAVSFFSGKPTTTTVSVQNILNNVGISSVTTARDTAALAQALKVELQLLQALLAKYQQGSVDAIASATPVSSRYVAVGVERYSASFSAVLPPVKKILKS